MLLWLITLYRHTKFCSKKLKEFIRYGTTRHFLRGSPSLLLLSDYIYLVDDVVTAGNLHGTKEEEGEEGGEEEEGINCCYTRPLTQRYQSAVASNDVSIHS